MADAPIKTTDGHALNAIGKGDIRILFPMGPKEKPTSVTLKNIYYVPSMAFTLVSISCIDNAGYALHNEGGTCMISGPKHKNRVIGCIPLL